MMSLPVWLPGPMFLLGVSVPGPMFLLGVSVQGVSVRGGFCRETPRMRKVVGMHPIGMLSCLIIIKAFSCDRRQEDWVKSCLSAMKHFPIPPLTYLIVGL